MTSHVALVGAAIVSGYMGLASAWQFFNMTNSHQEQQIGRQR